MKKQAENSYFAGTLSALKDTRKVAFRILPMILITGCLVFGGCGKEVQTLTLQPETIMQDTDAGKTKEQSAILYKDNVVTGYTVEKATNPAKVNLVGYMSEGNKQVWFDTDRAVTNYSVVDAKSNKVIQRFTAEKDENGLLRGDFSGLTTAGEYRIYSEQTGWSEAFSVTENPYSDFLPKLYADVYNAKSDYETALLLLQIYEWDLSFCGDNYGLSESGNNLPDVLDIVKKILDDADATCTGRSEATKEAFHAAALAQFSYYFKAYDSALSAEYLSLAQTILQKIKPETDEELAAYYDAQSILYRATEKKKYRNNLQDYLKNSYKGLEAMPIEIYGNLAYLNKRGEYTPTSYMTTLRQDLENRALIPLKGDINLYAGEMEDEDAFVYGMLDLCVFSCISPSYAYQGYLCSGLDYYLGINAEGQALVGTSEGENHVEDSRVPAIMIYMIYELNED